MTVLTDPIDVVHRDELAYVTELRRRLADVVAHVNRWEPRPCPPAERRAT